MRTDAAALLSRLRNARESLAALEAALQAPDASVWEEAAPRLQHVAGLLGAVHSEMAAAQSMPLDLRAQIRGEVQVLASDLRRVNELMRAAAGFYTAWAQLLGAVLGGYTPSGAVVPLEPLSRLSVRG